MSRPSLISDLFPICCSPSNVALLPGSRYICLVFVCILLSSLMKNSCANPLPGEYTAPSSLSASVHLFPSFSSLPPPPHVSLSAVLMIYDHTLTLATEVKFLWAAKFRLSIYWFMAQRYIGLTANIANCVIYFVELSPEVRVPLFSSVQTLTDLFLEVCIRIDVSSFVLKYPHSSCLQMQIMWKVLILIQETLVECASGPIIKQITTGYSSTSSSKAPSSCESLQCTAAIGGSSVLSWWCPLPGLRLLSFVFLTYFT